MNLDFGLRAEYSVQIVAKEEVQSLGEVEHHGFSYFEIPRSGDPSLLIKHSATTPWLCTLGGLNEKPDVQGVYACPSPKHFLAVVDNIAYYVDSTSPGSVTKAAQLVDSVEVSLAHNLLLVITNDTIIAYGKDGILWRSPELMPDGIYITHISKDLIWGHGDEVDGDYGEFIISVKDGSIVQHNWYTEEYYEDEASVSANRIHENIYRDSFSNCSVTEEDFFLLFYLIHNYSIQLKAPDHADNKPSLTQLKPLTQHDTSSILALLSADIHPTIPKVSRDALRAHWYWKWNKDWNGEQRLGKLRVREEKRLNELIEILLRNEQVAKVERAD